MLAERKNLYNLALLLGYIHKVSKDSILVLKMMKKFHSSQFKSLLFVHIIIFLSIHSLSRHRNHICRLL